MIPPVSFATSVLDPMAIPISALASAGASLIPSPTDGPAVEMAKSGPTDCYASQVFGGCSVISIYRQRNTKGFETRNVDLVVTILPGIGERKILRLVELIVGCQ
jgi:hypothetical protein